MNSAKKVFDILDLRLHIMSFVPKDKNIEKLTCKQKIQNKIDSCLFHIVFHIFCPNVSPPAISLIFLNTRDR